MNSTELQAEVLYSQLETELKSALAGVPKLAIVGIYSGGAWLAERLAKTLNVVETGFIDVSFYRDDYAKRGLKEEVRPSQIPFEIEGAIFYWSMMFCIPDAPRVRRSIRCLTMAVPRKSCWPL